MDSNFMLSLIYNNQITTLGIICLLLSIIFLIIIGLIILRIIRIHLISWKIKIRGYNSIAQTVSYGVQEIDLDGKILSFNDKYCDIIDLDPSNIIGTYVWDHIEPIIERNKFKHLFTKMVETGQVLPPTRLKLKSHSKYKRLIDVQLLIDFKKNKKNKIVSVVCTVTIITDVLRSERRQKLAKSVFDILSRTADVTEAIDRILHQFKTSTQFDAIAIRLYEENDGPYYKAIGHSDRFDEVQKCVDRLNINLQAKGVSAYDCFCGAVLSGKIFDDHQHWTEYGSFWCDDFNNFIKQRQTPHLHVNLTGNCFKVGYQTIGLIPLKIHNQIIGLLQLNDRRKNMLSKPEINFYEGIGNSIGIALSRKKSNELIKGIFDSAPIGIGIAKDRIIIEANDFLCKMTGYTRNQMVNKSVLMLYPNRKEFDRVGDYIDAVIKTNKKGSIKSQLISRNGKKIDILLNASRIGEIGELIISILDITHIKIADEKYKSLFSHMNDGFALHEMIYNDEDEPINYKFLAVNPAFETLTGLKSRDIIGNNVSDILPGVGDEWMSRFNQVVKTGIPINFQNESNDSHDAEKIYEITSYRPAPNQFACMFKDITESRLHQGEIAERERRFNFLVENLFDGFAMVDIATGFVFCNPAYERILGYTLEELKKLNVKDITHPDDWAWESEHIKKLLNGVHYLPYKKRYIHKNGKHIQAEIAPYPIISGGQVVQLWAIVRDLTTEIKSKVKIEEKEKQLRKASKMDAVGTLAGGIAHDFNNIIQIIQGNVEIMKMICVDKKLLSMLDTMFDATERGSNLSKRLLTFSSRVESELKPTNINDEVILAQKLLDRHATWPVLVEIESMLDEDLPYVLADTTQINQVLTNLCINAKDSMPEGGHIVIKTMVRNIDETYRSMHSQAKLGDYVQISISDNGEGIPHNLIDRIFEPFFTTKETGRGTGLGLAVVYGILKNHKGFITVYSELGIGTEFKIYIPIIDLDHIAHIETVETLKSIRTGTETVLIIDDEEAIRIIGESILTKYGYNVLTANDGDEGLKVFNRNLEEIDLVILDLVMPTISGNDVLTNLIEIKPDIKVVIASGYSTNGPLKNALNDGAKRIINKPYSLHELLVSIREVLDEE